MADVALTGAYPYLKINLDQAQREFVTRSVVTISCLAGSLLISMVMVGLHACGIWELLLRGNSPHRRASVMCKAGFPQNTWHCHHAASVLLTA